MNDEDRETCAGLQAAVFAPWVERIAAEAAAAGKAGPPSWDPPSVSLLNMELEPVLLSKAAQLGLPAQWVARLARLDNQRRQVSTLFSALWHRFLIGKGLAMKCDSAGLSSTCDTLGAQKPQVAVRQKG